MTEGRREVRLRMAPEDRHRVMALAAALGVRPEMLLAKLLLGTLDELEDRASEEQRFELAVLRKALGR